MELRVHGSDDARQAVLTARLDNLGKGASGAALQNLALMLGWNRRRPCDIAGPQDVLGLIAVVAPPVPGWDERMRE